MKRFGGNSKCGLTANKSGTLVNFVPPFINLLGSRLLDSASAW